MKAFIVVIGYNIADVLEKTINGIPNGCYDGLVFVDDGSTDGTGQVAKELDLHTVTHEQNCGYGAAQKSGYREAAKEGADLVVLVHGDNQYDPTFVPQFIEKIRDEGCAAVTGTRMILGDVLENGMPLWKFIPNRFLTGLENIVFGTQLSDYHHGYRAFSIEFIKNIPLDLLSDKFDFDSDIIIQAAIRKVKIGEIPHPTRYEDENQQMPFSKGVRYGLSILKTVGKYLGHRIGIWRQSIYEGV